MDNPASSIISALGAGSGVDFIQLAEDLSDATYSFRRFDFESRNETLDLKISSASLLRSTLTELASALGDRVRTGDLSPQASIGNTSVGNVSIESGFTPSGSYSLEVSQLAQGQSLVTQAYTTSDDLVGEGTLTFRFGSISGSTFTEDTEQTALDIDVDDTDTLSTLAAKITSESGGALNAYVSNGTGGAQLVIKGSDGASSGFVIEPTSTAASPSATPGDLTYLAWDPSTDAGELRQSAQDAEFELDTVALTNSSNSVTDLPEGMTLNLTGTNVGDPTTISFSNNTAAITDVMEDFVAALNDLAALVNEEAAGFGGTLANDPGARQLKRDLAELSSVTVMPSAADGEPSTLGDLGLSIDRDGNFTLDSDILSSAITNQPEATAAMFTVGAFGVFATMDNLARDNTSTTDTGSLAGSIARYEALSETYDERLEDIAEQQENLRVRLTTQLVAAERNISASQSTLSFLEQQIAAWNG